MILSTIIVVGVDSVLVEVNSVTIPLTLTTIDRSGLFIIGVLLIGGNVGIIVWPVVVVVIIGAIIDDFPSLE